MILPQSRILCLGDSLTARYAPVLGQRLRECYPCHGLRVIPAGVPSDTSRDAIQRVGRACAERPNVAIVGLGMNDRGLAPPRHVPEPEFRRNLASIVRSLQGDGARVLLLTLNPVAGAPRSRDNHLIRSYNQVVCEVAYHRKARTVDIHGAWERRFDPYAQGLEDGLHPNEEGVDLYVDEILRVLPRRKRIVLWQYNGNPCACNYRCPYCMYRGIQKGDHFSQTIRAWHGAFRGAFGERDLTFYLAHGEPMIGNRFYDVLNMVGDEPQWDVRMTSNISVDLQRLVSTRVAREHRLEVNASFHPHMVSRERFLSQALFLRQHGIEVPVIYVMYPSLLPRFEEDFAFFSSHQFLVHVRRFRGTYRRMRYPEAYTDEERQFIAKYCDDATIKYMLFNEPSRGKLTWSGVDFFIVDNAGNVGYCDDFRPDQHSLGNILEDTFRPLPGPHPFPGEGTSDGTVDGVANFVELGYEQLTGNNVLNFSRQGGVCHTPTGIQYKNMETDFRDPRTRAEYHFPPRGVGDAWAILAHPGEPLRRRMRRIAETVYPDALDCAHPATPRAFVGETLRAAVRALPGVRATYRFAGRVVSRLRRAR